MGKVGTHCRLRRALYGAYGDGYRLGCVQIDRNVRADSRNFDLQEVRLVVIAVKMQKPPHAVSESPQRSNLARSLRVHTKNAGSVSESPQNTTPAAELCKDRDKVRVVLVVRY